MFNATTGRNKSDQMIEDLSDLLAADVQDFLNDAAIDRTTKENLMRNMAEMVKLRSTALAVATGTYAQNNLGRPAAAIGTGQGQHPTTEQDALAFLMQAGSIPVGVKQALKRLMNTQDPAFIPVGPDGTPIEVGQLRQQVTTLTHERDDARHQLAAALAGSGIDALKTSVKAEIDKIKTAWGRKRVSRTNVSEAILGQADQTAVSDAIAAIERQVS